MRVRLHPDADSEVSESLEYFRSLKPPKGRAFLDEYRKAVRAILAAPDRFSPDEDAPDGCDIRMYLFPRFQRRIVFQIGDREIILLALAHTKQQSDYWLARLEP